MDESSSMGDFPLVARSAGLSSDDTCLKITPSSDLISFSLLVTNTDSGFLVWSQCNTQRESVNTNLCVTCTGNSLNTNLRAHTPMRTPNSSSLGIVMFSGARRVFEKIISVLDVLLAND